MAITAALRRKLANVRLLSLDLDGVLTDGGLYYTAEGDEIRKFDVKDGLGLKLLLAAGISVAIVTTSDIPAIRHRGRRLGIEHVFLGVEDKVGTIATLADKLGIELAQVAHVGDDINDLPLLEKVGLGLAVRDARPEVRAMAAYVARRSGGQGAVREICDLLLSARARLAVGKRR
jgi:3-deoxy-D-manno-octulosonate 8-phosphate phosphatase (KDO 8-P phosphatase)